MAEIKFDEKFVDPNTGETVTRLKIKPELLTELDKQVQLNAVGANNFLQIARQMWMMYKKLDEEGNKATKAEADIGKEVIKIREKMGVDSSWIYNIPLKMLEKREPPPETKIVDGGVEPPKKL